MADLAEPEEPDPDQSRRNVRLGALVLAVLAGLVGFNLVRASRSSDTPELSGALRASLEQQGCTVDSRSDNGQKHVPAATYSVDPPAGGDHDPVPSPAGFYDMTNVPADRHLVHSMEHGFVIVWYRPMALAPGRLDELRGLADRHRWVLVAPRLTMTTSLAATAWHRRLLCPDGTDLGGPIRTFITEFRDKGPEKGFV
jgi:uncharacterized protein DUF3105